MPGSPGLDVREERGPDQSIALLPTARTAFIGRTLRGPVGRPVLLKSFAEFQQTFGGLWQPCTLGYAVEQFFDNGGREALVVRIENGARCATLHLKAGAQTLALRAVRPGTREFLRACVDYDNIPADRTLDFNLTVQRVRMLGTPRIEDQEIFRGLSLDPDAPNPVAAALAASELVRLEGPLPALRPEVTPDPAGGTPTGYVSSNPDGDDGAPLSDYDLIGSVADRTGLFAFGEADQFNFLCIPPLSRERDVGLPTLLVAARLCRARRALLIVDPKQTWATADDALQAMHEWNFSSEDAVMFFPRILAHDKLRGRFETFAPCGAVAGMLARSDDSADPVLRQGFRPSCLVPEDRRRRLAALGVNTLQTLRAAGAGAPPLCTLAAASAGAPDWKDLRTRRLALFILNCVLHGTRWAFLAPPHAHTASLVKNQVRAFLERLHAGGAFGARSSEDAYFIITGIGARPAAAGDARDFHLLIGFAALRVGEFHSYRISHTAAGSLVQPVTLNRLNNLRYSPEEIGWAERLADELRL
jgi:hypothetical protein